MQMVWALGTAAKALRQFQAAVRAFRPKHSALAREGA